MQFQTIRDVDLCGKKVLLRVDINVPSQGGVVTDKSRIERLKPTIDYLRGQGAKIIAFSHFGRPKGEPNPALSLKFLIPYLEESWGCPVRFSDDCIGASAQEMVNSLENCDVGLLENVRFHKGEKKNDPAFIQAIASLGEIYVNDSFSTAHRAHASTEGLAHFLPAVAGLLMEEELDALNKALIEPQRPVAAITGGSKISTKLGVLENLVQKVDLLVLGGGMANTFIAASGGNVGASLCERDMAEKARAIMKRAQNYGCAILLQSDAISVKEIQSDAESNIVDAYDVPENFMAVDMGPESTDRVIEKLKSMKTLLWNGPLGVFEIKPFDAGTNKVAQAAAELTKSGDLISIAGGGDTVAALENAGVAGDFTYLSTAGGAFLEWIEGKELPSVAALKRYAEAA